MLIRIVIFLLFVSFVPLTAQEIDIKYADSLLTSISELDKKSQRGALDTFRKRLAMVSREAADPIFLHMIEKAPSNYTRMLVLGDFGEYLVSRDAPELALTYLTEGLQFLRSTHLTQVLQ